MQTFTIDIKEPEFVFVLTDYYGGPTVQDFVALDNTTVTETVTPGVSMVMDPEEIRRLRLAAREALEG